MSKPVYTTCQVERRFVRKSGDLNALTGDYTERSAETVTGPCDTPLFGVVRHRRGICPSCEALWEVPHNVITPAGRTFLRERGIA